MRIRHISQSDDTGCGIACLAMIFNLTYDETKQWMIDEGIFEPTAKEWGTTFADITVMLKKGGLAIDRKKKFRKWRNIPAKVAVASTNYDKKGWFHWILFIRDINGFYIYDPALNSKKIRDLRGKMAGWFIEVSQNNRSN